MTTESRNLRLDGLRGIAIGLVILQHFVANTARGAAGFLGFLAQASDIGWTGVDLFLRVVGLPDLPEFFSIIAIRPRSRFASFISGAPTGSRFRAVRGAPPVVRHHPEVRHGNAVRLADGGLCPVLVVVIFAQNYVMAHLNGFGGSWLGVTWSLAVEEQFYLTLPILALLLSRRALAALLLVLFFVAPAARIFTRGNARSC